jgi:hypothetical protein
MRLEDHEPGTVRVGQGERRLAGRSFRRGVTGAVQRICEGPATRAVRVHDQDSPGPFHSGDATDGPARVCAGPRGRFGEAGAGAGERLA